MLIDIFSDRYEHVGTAEKKDAHAQGRWHRTFSALLVNPVARTVTLQKKAPGRAGFDRPDYADFTVGGHYHAGEAIPNGVREAREELGLHDLDYPDFFPLGIRQTAVTLAPDRIEREFQHWHLLPLTSPLDDIPLDDAEVSGLVEIGLDDAIALAAGDRQAPAPCTSPATATPAPLREASSPRPTWSPATSRLTASTCACSSPPAGTSAVTASTCPGEPCDRSSTRRTEGVLRTRTGPRDKHPAQRR